MRFWRGWLLLMAALSLLVAGPQKANADVDGGSVCSYRSEDGFCLLWVESPGQPGSGGDSGSSGSTGTRTCQAADGEVACSGAYGTWDGSRQCYVRLADPQPPMFMAVWGERNEGVIMECTPAGGGGLSGTASYLYWAISVEASAAPDPRVLADRAISAMSLSAIRIGSSPHTVDRSPMSLGVVGRNVWMWVDDPSGSTFGPVTKSASAGGYTVVATARVVEVVWDMGDGTVVACGRGTAVRASTDDDPASPDCGHVYTHDGHYTITATSHWEIAWSGIGQSGTIPMELSVSEQLSIAEIQVVNVPVEQN